MLRVPLVACKFSHQPFHTTLTHDKAGSLISTNRTFVVARYKLLHGCQINMSNHKNTKNPYRPNLKLISAKNPVVCNSKKAENPVVPKFNVVILHYSDMQK